MREILRTNDLVRLSWFQALLSERSINSVVLDSHTSVLEGSVSAIPRRLMVREDDFLIAMRLLGEYGELDGGKSTGATDRLLDGRITLLQPSTGYRAAIDPVLLAAAVPAVAPDQTVLDVGCGGGAATLCYAERVPSARITGLELQPLRAQEARENVRINMMDDQVEILIGSLLHPPPELTPGSFAEVFANPPYLQQSRADRRTTPEDAIETVEGDAKLADWIAFCVEMAAPKGGITLVHRADRLDEIITLLRERSGGIVIFPLWPRLAEDGAPVEAKRVLIRAKKGSKTPLRLTGGMILHDGDGGYTHAAEAVLRHGEALSL
jgi:tRNA1(Val) A37 N6-methylase TrmN6